MFNRRDFAEKSEDWKRFTVHQTPFHTPYPFRIPLETPYAKTAETGKMKTTRLHCMPASILFSLQRYELTEKAVHLGNARQ
jgi:hypothetical protein